MMRTKAARVLIATAVFGLLALTPAFALNGTKVEADVPFAFVAGDMTFPAGHYVFTVEDPLEPSLLAIQSKDGHRYELMQTIAESDHSEPNDESKLVFERYGNDNYLSRVWVAGLGEGRGLSKSELERERVESMQMHREKLTLGLP